MPACLAMVVDLDEFVAAVEDRGSRWGTRTAETVDHLVRDRAAACPGASIAPLPPDSWIVTIVRPAPEGLAADAHTLAGRIRDDVARRTGLTGSVGISSITSGVEPAAVPPACERAVRQAHAALSVKAVAGGGRIYPTVAHRPLEAPDIATEVARLVRRGAHQQAVGLVEGWLQRILNRQAAPEVVFGRWLPALILDVAAAVDPHRSADGSPDWRSTLRHAPVAELAELTTMHERTHLRRWLTIRLRALADVALVSPPSPLILRAEGLIRARYGDAGLTLAGAAADLSVSPYHLAHVFRAELDTTFRRRLTGVRVRAAVALLRSGTGSVGEVARQCGFASTRQFRATLRRELGSSPTQLLGVRSAGGLSRSVAG